MSIVADIDSRPEGLVECFVALGANLGDPANALREALVRISEMPEVTVLGCSHLYGTEPIESSGPDYVNAVIRIATGLCARDLLHGLQKIENEMGRVRPAGIINAPRTLDLDVLTYGDVTSDDPELVLPHPRMHQRAFVLVPMTEIAPEAEIPGLGAAASYLDSVRDQGIDMIGSF